MTAILLFLWFALLSAGFVSVGWLLALRLAPEAKRPQMVRWLIAWGIRGLLAPLVVWALMNLGIAWYLQPFMPQIQAAQNRGLAWVPEFISVLAMGLFLLSSYWSAVTLGWLIVSAGPGADERARKDFKALCLTCVLALIIPTGIIFLLGGWTTFGMAATGMLAPIAGYGVGILQPKKLPPMYARAIARMKFGKYTEAEWEIIHELEKSEDDYEGWMMLAELYANNFHDLVEAERTILDICDQPKTTPSQLSVALHRLADWYLKFAQDPEAARRALQMVQDRLKGTHLAHMAQLRINQLPVTREELREQQGAKAIPLPALGDQLDLPPAPPEPEPDRRKAAKEANACVERLKQDPNNILAREKLARLFTEHLGQPDQGIEQLTLLLDMPDQPDGKRAEWLGFVAAWHIRYRRDAEKGRKYLEQLVQEFPQTPQAFAARRRLEKFARPDSA